MSDRRTWIERRRQIPDRDAKNARLVSRLLPFLETDRLIGFYIPLPEEADVMEAAAGRSFAAPRVISKTEMKFYPADDLQPGAFGVLEPQSDEEVVPDLVIVPMLAFCNGYRVGYGKGYYDRYLSKHPECKRIGIAYDEQEDDFIPQPWDECLDVLITPERVMYFDRSGQQKEGSK